jgi:hypothetical protein
MFYSYQFVTGAAYVPEGATIGADITLIVPWVVIGGIGGTSVYGVVVSNDISSPADVEFGVSSQVGLGHLGGAVMAGG